MGILRGCSLFNYKCVAERPLLALSNEFIHVCKIPYCCDRHVRLEAELVKYQSFAMEELEENEHIDLWDFWQKYSIQLPEWWDCVQEIVLMTPSSCTVERVFSILSHGMNDSQESSLEDNVAVSLINDTL